MCIEDLLKSPQWGDSSNYPKHMFLCLSVCLNIPYSASVSIALKIQLWYVDLTQSCIILFNMDEFILMVTSLGTNAVVVIRVHSNAVSDQDPHCLL